jgi:hypothetical protein
VGDTLSMFLEILSYSCDERVLPSCVYILLSFPIDHVTGKFGEQALNKNGLKLIDFATYNNTRIMNTYI